MKTTWAGEMYQRAGITTNIEVGKAIEAGELSLVFRCHGCAQKWVSHWWESKSRERDVEFHFLACPNRAPSVFPRVEV